MIWMTEQELIDTCAFEIPGSVPTPGKAREIAKRIIEIVDVARLRGDGAALSTQPAPSAPVDRQWVMDQFGFLEGLVNGSTYKDIANKAADLIDALTAPSEQVAASVPCAFRSLLAEARRQYRDSDAAGDVLAWLDERVLDVDHAASVAVPDEATLDRLASEAYEVHCNTPIGHFPNDSNFPKWRAVVRHVLAAAPVAPALATREGGEA